MEVKKCLNCGKEVRQVKGKRDRLYCDQNCKSVYLRKTKPKEKKYVQKETFERILNENVELKRKLSEVKITETPKDGFDGKRIDKIQYDEVGQYVVPHPLYKIGDPKENTMSFYNKYNCNNYKELEVLKAKL